MNVFSSLVALALLSATALGQMGKWDDVFDYATYLEEDQAFRLYWTNLEDGRIDIGIEALSTGWIALGFSPNGGMENSDIMMGWVTDAGEVILQDRFTDDTQTAPQLDESQDLTLVSGEQEDGITRIRFTRQKSNACDPTDDAAITVGTSRVIYAYNDANPVDDVPAYHGAQRGSQSVNLDAGQSTVVELEDDVEYFDLLMDDWAISSDDTEYVCKFFEMPSVPSKQHIVKIEPFLQSGNEGTVHHVLMYSCPDYFVAENVSDFDSSSSQAACRNYDELNMPSADCRSAALQFSWAIGGEATYFPEEAGLPFGVDFKYAFFEVHYDNPELRADIVDSSGLRIYYTPTLREHDIGVMWFGEGSSSAEGIYIPPGIETVMTGFCGSECTNDFLPENGVTMFGSMLHMHTVGTSITFRHIRGGVEQEPVEVNENYDFNFQQTTILEEPRTVLPGDEFLVECGYDTAGRDYITYGGEGSLNEMCIVFAFVYPAPDLYKCVNRPSDSVVAVWAQELYDAGYFNLPEGMLEYLTTNYSITSFGEIPSSAWEAVNVTWADLGDGQAMYDKLWTDEAFAERSAQCVVNDYLDDDTRFYTFFLPDFEVYEAEEEVCDESEDEPSTTEMSGNSTDSSSESIDNGSGAVRMCMGLVSMAMLVVISMM